MSSKPERNEVVKHLQACVASSKGGVPLSTLGKDYQIISGNSLPYKGLGFAKLEDFIQSIPDLKLINGPKGEMVVQATSNEKSSHLARIVAMQKQANKNTRFIPRSNMKKQNETQTRKPWTRSANWSPPNASNNNNNKSLRTPSLLRNMSQPSPNIPKTGTPLNRSHSSPGNKTSRQESSNRGTNRISPDKTNSIPPLLSLDCPVPQQIVLKTPGMSGERRKQPEVKNQRKNSGNNNTNEIIYSSVLSPAASVKNPNIPTAEIKATEPITVLKKYVTDHKLGNIEFKTIELVTGSTKQYISYICVGKDFKVSTYPNGGNTTQEALELAAQLAYDSLLAKMSAASVADLPATENASEALKRILKILEAHPNGVWANKVPDEYMALYGEQLPSDWLQQTMDSPYVDPNVISDKQIILVLSEGGQSPKKATKSSTPLNPESPSFEFKTSESSNISDASESPEFKKEDASSSECSSTPPPLIFPKDENWDVYVTNANSTTDLWLRLVGDDYSSKYENLATEMELHYLERGPSVCEQVQEGCYYALELDDCVHRVQVATIEGDEVHCLLLDHGQVEKVNASELRQLDEKFLTLPFQAVQCELRGLEEFGTASEVQAILLEVVVGKTLVATPTKDVLGQTYMVGTPAVTLVLYDTSTDDDVDINQQLWRIITSKVLLPRLPQEGRVAEVAVPHITSSGHIYVQLHKSVLICLQDKILLLQPDKMPKGSVKQPAKATLYLAPYVDGSWYRALMLGTEEEDKVHVQFIDYGNDCKVDKNSLLELEPLSPELAQIPQQAVLCRLHQLLPNANVRVCERTVKRMADLLRDQADKSFLLKVVNAASSNNPASVELFLRMSSENLLVSLNSTIALDENLFDVIEEKQPDATRRGSYDKEKLLEKERAIEKMTDKVPRGLSQPKIPEIGGFFDISVTLAASPGNFVVQPWELSPQLEQLMVSLQSLYGAGSPPMQPLISAEIREGGIYAAMHNDTKWYRVQVNNLLKGDHITVYFVDFGDHTVLTIDKLRPLAAKFCKLPYQAIKAKISGIRPKHNDWSVEDCVRFQELVCNRQFVSVVEETGPDLINPSDTVLGLRLIDTSQDDKDLDVGELLVKEQRAVFIA